jgi:hypothetical protein
MFPYAEVAWSKVREPRNGYFSLSSLKSQVTLCLLYLRHHFLLSETEPVWSREKSLLLSRTEPRFLRHSARSTVTIIPKLSQLQQKAKNSLLVFQGMLWRIETSFPFNSLTYEPWLHSVCSTSRCVLVTSRANLMQSWIINQGIKRERCFNSSQMIFIGNWTSVLTMPTIHRPA